MALAIRTPAETPTEPVMVPGDSIPGEIQVLNATDTRGLARASTRFLRKAGLDVVYFGTASLETELDSTLIVMRTSDSTVALRVKDALGLGRISVDLDSGLLVDVTVLLGLDARGLFERRP